jgi:3-oxoacyl-[acyl-carrier protein] reductase
MARSSGVLGCHDSGRPALRGVDVDVTDRGSVEAMIGKVRAEFGRLDVLVNNAGLWRGLADSGLLDCPDRSGER